MNNRYRAYYGYKVEAQTLKQFSFCLHHNPKLMTQSDFSIKFLPIWLPLYRFEQVLPNSSYIIHKVGTIYTQCVHRIRLRAFVPQYPVDDLQQIVQEKFQRDLMFGRIQGEPAIFGKSIPTLLLSPSEEPCVAHNEEKPPQVTVSLSFHYAPAVFPMRPAPGPGVPLYQLPQRCQQFPHRQLRTMRRNNNQRLCHIWKMNPRILSSLHIRLQMTTRHDKQVHLHPPRPQKNHLKSVRHFRLTHHPLLAL